MPKYEVIRPWFGKKKGDIVTLAKVHPALAANVRLLQGEVGEAADLVAGDDAPATEIDLTDKDAVMAELKRQRIQFDARKSVETLAELLPKK